MNDKELITLLLVALKEAREWIVDTLGDSGVRETALADMDIIQHIDSAIAAATGEKP